MSGDGEYEAPLYLAGEPQSKSDIIIYTTHYGNIAEILCRYGVDVGAGYTRHGILVGASLEPDQLTAIRRDRHVDYVERDCVDHVARYFRAAAGGRVEGHYTVRGDDNVDIRALIDKYGIQLATTFSGFAEMFSAKLSDEQRDQLRREPDVHYVQDELYDYPMARLVTES